MRDVMECMMRLYRDLIMSKGGAGEQTEEITEEKVGITRKSGRKR